MPYFSCLPIYIPLSARKEGGCLTFIKSHMSLPRPRERMKMTAGLPTVIPAQAGIQGWGCEGLPGNAEVQGLRFLDSLRSLGMTFLAVMPPTSILPRKGLIARQFSTSVSLTCKRQGRPQGTPLRKGPPLVGATLVVALLTNVNTLTCILVRACSRSLKYVKLRLLLGEG